MLELKLLQENKNSFTLTIRDNGKGMPDQFNLSNSKSFGLRLVNILTKQLNGDIQFENNNGLKYTIRFQLI